MEARETATAEATNTHGRRTREVRTHTERDRDIFGGQLHSGNQTYQDYEIAVNRGHNLIVRASASVRVRAPTCASTCARACIDAYASSGGGVGGFVAQELEIRRRDCHETICMQTDD